MPRPTERGVERVKFLEQHPLLVQRSAHRRTTRSRINSISHGCLILKRTGFSGERERARICSSGVLGREGRATSRVGSEFIGSSGEQSRGTASFMTSVGNGAGYLSEER